MPPASAAIGTAAAQIPKAASKMKDASRALVLASAVALLAMTSVATASDCHVSAATHALIADMVKVMRITEPSTDLTVEAVIDGINNLAAIYVINGIKTSKPPCEYATDAILNIP
jgi:hypothetical protein